MSRGRHSGRGLQGQARPLDRDRRPFRHWPQSPLRPSRPSPSPCQDRHAGGLVVWRPKGKAAAQDVLWASKTSSRAPRPDGQGRDRPRARLCDARLLDLDLPRRADRLGFDPDGPDRRLDRPRQVEGRIINAKGKSLDGICWAPIDTREAAFDLITFLGKLGASNDLKSRLSAGRGALIRDPLAPDRRLARHRRHIRQ